MENNRKKTIDKLRALYVKIDAQTAPLAQMHAGRLNCRRSCAACCVDDITVFDVEAANIRRNHAALLARAAPRAAGGCAFLDGENSCRIYENRPYVCRTQGLPLRWLEEDFKETLEYRDICPLNEDGQPIEQLSADECWTLGKAEAALAALQIEFGGGEMKRTKLRDLFGAADDAEA